MKPLDELDHYEVLEIPPGAGYEDIERAYRMTRAAYTEGSMALYSIFNCDDAEAICGRIDEAYRILKDPEVRAKYDAESGFLPTPPPNLLEISAGDEAGLGAANLGAGHGSKGPGELLSAIELIDDLDSLIDEDTQEIDGGVLRRSRLRRGVELDQISEATKVSVSYLGYLENEEFDQLPASVYIRGFVHAYARAIGLDADRVAASYMLRVDGVRNAASR